MDKNSIKDLLTNTFVTEAKVPGLDVTNKAKSESGKQNKKAIKDIESDLSDYDKESKDMAKDSINPVKFNYTDGSEEEYHQEMEIMNGQEMIQYDRTPSDKFKERAEEAIAGSSNMGNNPEWANVVAKGQGGDPDFGKKLVKAIKSSEKKRSKETPTSKMFGDDWEVVEDQGHKPYAFENKENNKKTIKESNKMKRLTFKKPFNGVDTALNLIPESYKVDNKIFELSDGNESYRVRWEGSLTEGKAIVLLANNKDVLSEDMQKIKHLMGYKSQDTFGTLKGSERLTEDKKFSEIWNKTKSLLNENVDEWSEKQLDAFDKDGDGTPFEPEDMSALRKDENMSMDAQRIDTMVDKNSALNTAIGKINTKQELIDTMAMLYGDILKNNPQLASSEMALITALKAKTDELQSQGQQQAPMATSEMEMHEMDRFEEVFAGMDEEEHMGEEEHMEEGFLDAFKSNESIFFRDNKNEIERIKAMPNGDEKDAEYQKLFSSARNWATAKDFESGSRTSFFNELKRRVYGGSPKGFKAI
jgi:hypothetical protein